MRKILMFVTLLLAFCCFTACAKSNTIKIGTSGPLSGDNSVYGITVKKGMELAIKEINEAGGVNVDGEMRDIEQVGFIDDVCDSDTAKTAFNSLYDKGLDFYIGAVTSGATEGAVSGAVETGIPLITPTGTADGITVGSGGNERALRTNIFRACFNDSYQGYVMAKFSSVKGYKKVAVLYNNQDAYSTGLFNAFVDTVTEYKLNIEVKGFPYNATTSNFDSFFQGENIQDSTFDAAYIPDYYQKASVIIRSGRDNGFTKAFLGCDGWDGINTVDGFDTSSLQGCYFSNHFAVDSTDEKVKAFVAAYRAEYNEDPTALAVLGYDAVYIMKKAIEDAKSTDYDKVVAALSSNTFLAEVVTGNITFDANGNPKKAAVVMTFDAEGKMKFETNQD